MKLKNNELIHVVKSNSGYEGLTSKQFSSIISNKYTVGKNAFYSNTQDAINEIKKSPQITLTAGITGTLNAISDGDTIITCAGSNLWTKQGAVFGGDSAKYYVWTPDNIIFYRILEFFNENTFLLSAPYRGNAIPAGSEIIVGNAKIAGLLILDGEYENGLDLSNNLNPLYIQTLINPGAIITGGVTGSGSIKPPQSGYININGGVFESNGDGLMNTATYNGIELYYNNITQYSSAVDTMAANVLGIGNFIINNSKLEFSQDGLGLGLTWNRATISNRFITFNNCEITGVQRSLNPSIPLSLRIRALLTNNGTGMKFNDCNINLNTFNNKECQLVDLNTDQFVILNNCNVNALGDGSGKGSPLGSSTTSTNNNCRIDIYGGNWNVTPGDSFIEPKVYTGTATINMIGLNKNNIPVGGGGTLVVTENNTFNL